MTIQQSVQTLFQVGTTGALTDSELLGRFREAKGERAERAFSSLVERHGGMVLRVCRSILRDEHDALDAFQATFLVLVRRASSLRIDGSIAPWLHGVAMRTALYSRRSSTTRMKHEARWRERSSRTEVEPGVGDDLAEVIHQEIENLPGPFRGAVIVCDLEGLTQEQAAQRLGWRLGTLQSRLARGRAKLRVKLQRRGFGQSAERTGLLVFSTTGLPSVPTSIVEAIVSGRASAAVASLAQSISRSLFMANLKMLLAASVFVGLTSVGLTWGAVRYQEPKPANKPDVATPSPKAKGIATDAPGSDGRPSPRLSLPIDEKRLQKLAVGDRLRIDVLECLPGRPIEGIRKIRTDGTISLGFYGDLEVAGLNRNQIKIKLVEHLRKFLNDDALGLIEIETDAEGNNGKTRLIPPLESSRVFVEDGIDAEEGDPDGSLGMDRKIDEIAKDLKKLQGSINSLPARVQGRAGLRSNLRPGDEPRRRGNQDGAEGLIGKVDDLTTEVKELRDMVEKLADEVKQLKAK